MRRRPHHLVRSHPRPASRPARLGGLDHLRQASAAHGSRGAIRNDRPEHPKARPRPVGSSASGNGGSPGSSASHQRLEIQIGQRISAARWPGLHGARQVPVGPASGSSSPPAGRQFRTARRRHLATALRRRPRGGIAAGRHRACAAGGAAARAALRVATGRRPTPAPEFVNAARGSAVVRGQPVCCATARRPRRLRRTPSARPCARCPSRVWKARRTVSSAPRPDRGWASPPSRRGHRQSPRASSRKISRISSSGRSGRRGAGRRQRGSAARRSRFRPHGSSPAVLSREATRSLAFAAHRRHARASSARPTGSARRAVDRVRVPARWPCALVRQRSSRRVISATGSVGLRTD